MSSGTLQARGVVVRRGTTTVLDGVDLSAGAGQVVALVGPNGSGKSTLLGVMAGDEEPEAGEVLLDGQAVLSFSSRERARRRAVLEQDSTVAFGYRVADVVGMGRVAWERTPAAADDLVEIERAMQATKVAHLSARTVRSLSGGEQARVALARVLAQKAPVLLLDEPAAALDLHHGAVVLELARRYALDGGTVVVVLHDLTAAAHWADAAVLLDNGRVAAAGSPAEVFVPEQLSEVYGHPIDVFPHPISGRPVVAAAVV